MGNIISVILPVYNGEKYLDEAIQSILSQTYAQFEFIIINDGSSDSSLEIIKKYKKIDHRIILVDRENRGLVASLNEGISLSKGNFIARMDQDDISLKNRFKEQVDFLEKHNDVGVCGCWVEVFSNNREISLWKLPTSDTELKIGLLFSVPFAHPSIMMRKALITKLQLRYNEKYQNAEDYKFWVDFSKYTKFANISKVLFRYRYLETSMSRIADATKNDERYKTLSNIFIQQLDILGIYNTEKENRLHFVLMKNDRIERSGFSVQEVEVYLKKMLNQNKKSKIYSEKEFREFLGKKYIAFLFFKKSKNIVTFNYILIFFGLIKYIKGRLEWS